ncbi:MAG: ribosome maturation factor RimP [Oscillospiraceae bacterium]|nr:ribosome maturation factor RimP [Oscillospiraceae bacterium]MDD6527581.1 ribosome maturation factor RimP [Oscillospiraceae bacterium]
MAKGGNTVAAVRKIVEPIAEQLGLEIWDIRFLKEGTTWYLRIFIDKDGGVSIDDCVEMTRAINKPLDEADPIEQAYCLEVSSPGIERELTRDEHFLKCIGQKIMVRTIRPIDGKRDFKGVLESYDNGTIGFRADDGSGLAFTKKEVSFVKLDDFPDEF